ncbi:hypothetical protein JYU34_014709 [Plutella xylostella]|uniref:DUF4746 domain-containing protein n=2 Tax=Plutella xylostella TaxID=51655 RepID=A0ABQ7Q907_PLUXY|nr:hypothetical protein JYU34_014709 [Plutella xylostella]
MHIAFMLSAVKDVPVLQLMDLFPEYVSRDTESGEDECAAMFPVGYAEGYPWDEDFTDRETQKVPL